MKSSPPLFWGILLLVAGILGLAQQLGYTSQFTPQAGIAVLAGISILAFIMYLVSGWRRWGWLFLVGIFGGLAVSAAIATAGIHTPAAGTPLFVGLTIPFVAAFAIDRVRNWWALIPGGAMLFLALTTLVVDSQGGEWIGALFLFVLALGFLVVYLNNPKRTWGLLVAYILAVLGVAPLATRASAGYYGAIFLFASTLPFFVVYFRFPRHWWAIIPAGVLTVVAFVTALAISGSINSNGGYVSVLINGGIALTFAVVWLRNAKPWAKVVTIVLAAIALISVVATSYAGIVAPAAIILVGAYLIFTALRPKAAA